MAGMNVNSQGFQLSRSQSMSRIPTDSSIKKGPSGPPAPLTRKSSSPVLTKSTPLSLDLESIGKTIDSQPSQTMQKKHSKLMTFTKGLNFINDVVDDLATFGIIDS